MIQLESAHLKIIKDILNKYPYVFYAFGSRVKKTSRKFSDLDICYKENISKNIISEIREAFEQSNLPFKVDLVDFNKASKDFQELIEKDLEKI